jgi:hypothetical protein
MPFLKYAKPADKCVARSAPKMYLSRLPLNPSWDHLKHNRAVMFPLALTLDFTTIA